MAYKIKNKPLKEKKNYEEKYSEEDIAKGDKAWHYGYSVFNQNYPSLKQFAEKNKGKNVKVWYSKDGKRVLTRKNNMDNLSDILTNNYMIYRVEVL